MRAQRHWHIVFRFGRYYVENQWGGFALWHNDLHSARMQGLAYENEGDTFDPTPPS